MIGNAWHIPRNVPPLGVASMRFPVEDIDSGVDVVLSNGNQFRGSGNAANQTQSGSRVMIRRAGEGAFTELPMQFQGTFGNDKFFFATVPADRFPAGSVVQYYFKIDYTDRDTTFVHGDDGRSIASASEAAAQANAFSYPVRPRADAEGATVAFNAGALQGRVYRSSGHIEVAGPDLAGIALANVVTFAPPAVELAGRLVNFGRVVTSTPLGNGVEVTQEVGSRQVHARLTSPLNGVMRYEVVDWGGEEPSRVVLASESKSDEHFYGFGEKFNDLDQAGNVIDMRVFDAPGDKGDNSYKVVPWFVSRRGYGVHVDGPGRSTFDMRTALHGRYRISAEATGLRFDIVYGPRLTDVLTQYTEIVGRPPLPPPWVFGHWISSDEWRSGGEVRYAVSRFRERGIPSSIFVFDSPWEVAYNDFRFNQEQFAAAESGGHVENQNVSGFASIAEMMRFLQQNGLKVVCWMTPFVNVSSLPEGIRGQNVGRACNYNEGAQNNLFVRDSQQNDHLIVDWWKGTGSPIDFTKPEARTWVQDQLRALLRDSEVDTANGRESAVGGFKTDDGEFGNGQEVYIPARAAYANGLNGRQFVNGYCVEYHRTVYDVLGQSGFLFARSGFSGTQAFPAYWAGDNQPNFGDENGLRSVIVAGLSAAMSGYSIWAHDIGGYQNASFSPVSRADLFIRWTQFGCFSPIMQIHRQVNRNNLRQYPWGYAEPDESTDNNRALDNYRFYARLHTRLFPYLYTYARVSQDTGLPIMRPLVLHHQDDPRTFPVRHTYYFGAELLVAPVIQPRANSRRVYLPEGEWIDFWTHQRHQGKQDVTWQNPMKPAEPRSKIPVFVRSGAIVPFLLGDDVDSLCDANYINNPGIKTWDGGLDIHVYPDGNSSFDLFDGARVTCSQVAGATTVTVNSPSGRAILLRILAARPASVRRDGATLPEQASVAGFESSSAAWRFDAASGFVLVKFPHPAGSVMITF
jgi:alpha-D-xyloside xylohydrolase